jgi:hypothetical protein
VSGAVIYGFQRYRFELSVYNFTNQRNRVNTFAFGNDDFLTRVPSTSFDFRFRPQF